MKKPFRGRPSEADRKRAINAAFRFYGMPEFQTPVKEKQARIKRPQDGKPAMPLEKEVLADALEALRNDPRVWFADRRQSGVFQDGDRYIRVGTRGVLDVSGMLHGGRYFEIEAKRPGEKPDENQERRIANIRAGGGVSGYFTSSDEALGLLP